MWSRYKNSEFRNSYCSLNIKIPYMHLKTPPYVKEHSPWSPHLPLYSGVSHLYLHIGFPSSFHSRSSLLTHTLAGRITESNNNKFKVMDSFVYYYSDI